MNSVLVTTKGQTSHVCTETELNLSLIEIIEGHAAKQPLSATYVVEFAALFGLNSSCSEKCLVIVLPTTFSQDIPFQAKSLKAEVRATPEGDSVACLRLADGAVAVSERAIFASSPQQSGRLVTLWMFKEARKLCEFPYAPEIDEDLWVATQVAQSNENQCDDGQTASSNIIELFDNFVIHGAPA